MKLEEMRYFVYEAYGSGDRYIDADYLPEQVIEVEDLGWDDEGKYQYGGSVVKDTTDDTHFMITQSRSGSYYSDYYYGTPEVTRVKPTLETITRVVWKEVKQ